MESFVRLAGFLGVLLVMASWELIAPRRTLTAGKGWRWSTNLVLTVINTVAARLLIPLSAAGLAEQAAERGWGILNLIDLPFAIELMLSVVALDLAIFGQHVLFHAAPWLWRVHRVHHADLDCDASTGLRFHTLEILLSSLFKLGLVLLIGPPVWGVIAFEVVLNATSIFSHSNIWLPAWCDRGLRWLIVTPDMHRVHHSEVPAETNSNFGFNLSCWDRLFRTYRDQPAAGHDAATIGLPWPRDEAACCRLPGILRLPFRNPPPS